MTRGYRSRPKDFGKALADEQREHRQANGFQSSSMGAEQKQNHLQRTRKKKGII